MENFLRLLYTQNNYPSKAKLLKLAKEQLPNTKAKEVNDFIDAQLSYQLLKETKDTKTRFGSIVAFKNNEIWQIDIFDVSRFDKSNKGFKYMFAVVDVFSRHAFVIPMKTKDIDSTTISLEAILSVLKVNEYPNLIMSDNDGSFMGEKFQKVLVKHNIHHMPNAVGDHHALGIIDNFAKRLKRILTAQFLETKNKNWIDSINKIVQIYNASPHSSLGGFSPNEVMENLPDVTQYIFLVNIMKSQRNATVSDLVVGDNVRLRIGNEFSKGTDARYSNTVHKVKEVYGKNVLLDNDKKYVRSKLLKVPENSVSVDKPNIIQQAKDNKKLRQVLKSNDHTAPTLPARLRRKQPARQAKK